MEQTYHYAWIIPFVPLPVPMLTRGGTSSFSQSHKKSSSYVGLSEYFILIVVMNFSANLSIQQINSNSIYQYIWSWTLDNDFSFEFGYLIVPLTSIMLLLITTVGIMVLIYYLE